MPSLEGHTVARLSRLDGKQIRFFKAVRQHTLGGFLIDPDSDRGGNRDGVGWKVIGREREHMFHPPFGYYDTDYKGWQPVSEGPGKK